MSYTVTIKVVDCASPMTLLSGASLSSGTVALGVTDANGERIIAVLDDFDYIVTVNKFAQNPCEPTSPDFRPGYIAKNFVVDKSQDGTIQTVCLNQGPPPEPCGEGPSIECFIVTAATGSAKSKEVTGLRQLRERVRAVSMLGGNLIDVIYEEYAQFSPQIASRLTADAVSRLAVLETVVKPLFAWYTLAGKLAMDQPDATATMEGVQQLKDACPPYLCEIMLDHLEALSKGNVLADTPEQLSELAPRIAKLPFASWAILDPLIRTCHAVRDGLDMVNEVAQWLAAAPLEFLVRPQGNEAMESELHALARFFDFKPSVRPQLGNRLLIAWPDAVFALENSGFISTTLQKQ